VRGLRYVVERNRRYQLQGALRSLQAKLELAREIQGHLMCAPVNLPSFEAWASVTPAADLSGDFADALAMPDGSLAVALGDVTGHGFGSAILMATARAYLRTLLLEGCQIAPSRVLQRMNALLSHDVGEERFVAMSLAVLSPSGEMTFASAGQPPAYLLHSDGQEEELSTPQNLPLGIEADAQYAQLGPIAVRPGDVLAMSTDGVLEAASPSGQLFEAERLLQGLRQAPNQSCRALVEYLQKQLDEHCATLPQRDDQSLLVVRVLQP
jgi:sigma-B regulation protein RsbU (phosphoserine phosphatase)